MSNVFLIFLVGYFAISVYYLVFLYAYPSQRCKDGDLKSNDQGYRRRCAKPILKSIGRNAQSDNRLLLEIWMQYEMETEDISLKSSTNNIATGGTTHQRRMEWKLLPTCPPIEVDLSPQFFEKFKLGGKGSNCTLEFPTFSRIREDRRDHTSGRTRNTSSARPSALKAKFVLKQSNAPTPNGVIAQTTFDLTRIVERKHGKTPFFKYYKQPIVLRLVVDDEPYPIRRPVRGDGLVLTLVQPEKPNGSIYHLPTFYVDDVALKYSSHIELASPEEQAKNPRPPLTLSMQFSIISPRRHVFHRQLEIGLSVLENILNAEELDEIRHMISDEYIYRFILTQIISTVHIYLDYMAFRDEVIFYVGKKSMGGVSFSSVLGRFVCQFIIFLYLCDGGNTSWLVLASIGSGVLIELWKVFKFLRPKVVKAFPFIVLQNDTKSMSQLEKDTINYDSISRTYLCLLLYPLVVGSAIYARKFYVYASWWSWLISNLANAVYTFGFITLCPQLYVNYKLKSVAHLPWKVFVYKIFNTFVDDVFAFMIQMPLKHKLMTLRDDVVFFIFLIQAYMYRVDKSRINEFGYAYEEGATNGQQEQTNAAKLNQTKDTTVCGTHADDHAPVIHEKIE